MAENTIQPFQVIKYTTSYGENCTATKKDGIVTIQGDKNGVRQMPVDEFMTAFLKDQQKVQLERTPKKDTVSFSGNSELTDSEKKELIAKARCKASGWSIFGGIFSTAYYGLRSDEKIAKKYNLDAEKDKKLIKEIKSQQTLWTLPGALLPGGGGVAAWLYNNAVNPEKIDL